MRSIATPILAASEFRSTHEVVALLGQPVHAITGFGAIAHILSELQAGRGGWVATHNLDHLRRLTRSREFSELCASANIRTADGAPLIWAARLKGTPLPERVAGSDLTFSLTEAAAMAGRSVFLLGGNPGTAELAGGVLRDRYPGLVVAGAYCPPVGFERDAAEMDRIFSAVTTAKPDIIYVALGSPKQEQLILQLLQRHPKAWYLGVGVSLSFVTGEVRRAPRWMQRTGLEWVHRLWQEPRRLARRYLVDGLPFAAKLLVLSAAERFSRR
jgi:N-acetylglucosaminyldiphosphoundecaprenol N-acetyl-beta-D-mannosaminyltransferase